MYGEGKEMEERGKVMKGRKGKKEIDDIGIQ